MNFHFWVNYPYNIMLYIKCENKASDSKKNKIQAIMSKCAAANNVKTWDFSCSER